MTENAVRERPKQMTAPEVRAILDDRKSMMRVLMKPQPVSFTTPPTWRWRGPDGHLIACESGDNPSFYSPFVPEMRLWVKHPCRVSGRSANGFRVCDVGFPRPDNDRFFYWHEFKYRVPKEGSYFGATLPRALSRLTLEITDVRVERLKDISDFDIRKEGVD